MREVRVDLSSSPEISARETEVMTALGGGLSNAQIARRMHISVRTVEGHVSSLLRKYGVADRQALAARAGKTDATVALPGAIAGLPRAQTSFVGRHSDLDAVRAGLAGGGLVTLAGPGGVGKTRLAGVVAEAVVREYRYGAAFVDLAPVRDGLVGQAVAATLGVSEHPHQPVVQAVVALLSRGPSLLVLDNCEHLPDAVAEFVEQVLATCPTTILATSRERLGLPGERVYQVAPLPLGTDAEALFRDRAELADAGDLLNAATVTDLCARLDGLPLAIELAAARAASLGTAGLLTGLGDYLRLLAGGRGSVVRHRSLGAVIGWSHDLLAEDERAVFRRLTVFVGDFDLPAAAAVAGADDVAGTADVLGRLVDKSLVRHRHGSWRMLDTIRAFAAEQLAADPAVAEVWRRYRCWATDTAADLADRLGGDWRDDFDRVAGDLRAAPLTAPDGPDAVAHRLTRLLGRLTFARGFPYEAVGWHEHAARRATHDGEAARDLGHAADYARVINDSDRTFALWLAAADRARAAGDGNAIAIALARAVEIAGRFSVTFHAEIPFERRRELLAEASAAGDRGDPVVAAWLACAEAWTTNPEVLRPGASAALAAVTAARATGDPVLISASLDVARTAAVNEGRASDVHQITSERLTVLAGLDPLSAEYAAEIDDARGLASLAAVAAGDLPAARAAAASIVADDLHGDSAYLNASKTIPVIVLSGDLDEAVRLAELVWDGWERAGRPKMLWIQVTTVFVLLAHGLREDRDGMDRWRARITQHTGPYHYRMAPLATFVEARIALHLGDLDRAAELAERAWLQQPEARYQPFAHAAATELAVAAGLPRAGADLAALAEDSEGNDWVAATMLRATGRHHHDPDALSQSARIWARLGARFEHTCTMTLLPK